MNEDPKWVATQVSSPGTGANTRARNLLKRFQASIDRLSSKYRAALDALDALEDGNDWKQRFRPLSPDDLRGPNGLSPEEVSDATGTLQRRRSGAGEGRRHLSWIWTVAREGEGATVGTDDSMDRCTSPFPGTFLLM